MSLKRRIAKLEKFFFGERDFVGLAISHPDGTFTCSGANVTSPAEYVAFVEEFEKNSDYKIIYIADFARCYDKTEKPHTD